MASFGCYHDDIDDHDGGSSEASPTSVAVASLNALIERQLCRTTASQKELLGGTSTDASSLVGRTSDHHHHHRTVAVGRNSNTNTSTNTLTTSCRGILRNRSVTPSHWPLALDSSARSSSALAPKETDDDDCSEFTSSAPRQRARVRFPQETTTAVRTRPRTHVLDLHTLHYSEPEIRRFKKEYRLEKQEKRELAYRNPWSSFGAMGGSADEGMDHDDDAEGEGEEGDIAAEPSSASLPVSIVVTDGRSLSSIAGEVAREAFLNAKVRKASSTRTDDPRWSLETRTTDPRAPPSHWIHCATTEGDNASTASTGTEATKTVATEAAPPSHWIHCATDIETTMANPPSHWIHL